MPPLHGERGCIGSSENIFYKVLDLWPYNPTARQLHPVKVPLSKVKLHLCKSGLRDHVANTVGT